MPGEQPPYATPQSANPDTGATPMVVINRFPPGEVARGALALLGVILGAYFLWRIQEVLLLFFMAVLLATAIEPIVKVLRRGPFTRGTGVLAVYTMIVLLIGVPLYVSIPTLVAQSATFVEGLPERLLVLRGYAQDLQPRALHEAVVNGIDRGIAALQAPAPPGDQQIVEVGATAAHTVISFFTVFVLAFYWLVERASLKRVLLRLVSAERAREVNTVWMEVEEKLGGWVRGQIILMIAIGVMAGVGYFFIGLPNPALLAVLAGLFEIVPMIGPFLAFAPAVLVALAIDPSKALIVVVYAFVIQQIESNFLVPRVMGHTVGVSPLTVLLGILVGSVLYGVPGAFLAVPIAGAIQVILAHTLRAEDPSQAEAHHVPTPTPVPAPRPPTDPRQRSAAA